MLAGRPGTVWRDAGVGPARPGAVDSDLDAGVDVEAIGDFDADGGAEDDARPAIRFEGGDGTSCEMAVVILGAQSEFQGVGAEHAWLRSHYYGYRLREQALTRCNDHFADIMSIRTALGDDLDIYFDIEGFFGR